MSKPPVQLGASILAFYDSRPPGGWPRLDGAVRRLIELDPSLGVEVWGAMPFADAARGPLEMGAAYVTVHVRVAYWSWNPENLHREVVFAERVGGRTLVLHPVCLGLGKPDAEINAPAIRRLCAAAARRGVRLAVETMPDSMTVLDRLLDGVGDNPESTNLGICLDVGHAQLSRDAGNDPVRDYLERYAGQLLHLHLHDNHGDADEHLIPGHGAVDWRQTVDVINALGFSGTAVIEIHPGDAAPIEAIDEGLMFMRRLLR